MLAQVQLERRAGRDRGCRADGPRRVGERRVAERANTAQLPSVADLAHALELVPVAAAGSPSSWCVPRHSPSATAAAVVHRERECLPRAPAVAWPGQGLGGAVASNQPGGAIRCVPVCTIRARITASSIHRVIPSSMSTTGPPDRAERHAGCRVFTSPTGLSGFAVGAEGKHAGWLYDFFVSPRAEWRMAYDMMSLAVEQGVNNLTILEHVFVARFFEQFGFQAIAVSRPESWDKVPPHWMLDPGPDRDSMECPSFLFMMRVASEFRPASPRRPDGDSPAPGGASVSRQTTCGHCAQAITRQVDVFGAVGGYDCPRCGFIFICGTLTMGPP